ncbi:hypothetical protein B0J18DRAFT_240900 [Chaetomium sp. MPI-SDFR-AT-0129]|nr:hypothetical protein B0J18DRAFT_240900 [Chaetomium sp. MPI-SDFR-AT-0129]
MRKQRELRSTGCGVCLTWSIIEPEPEAFRGFGLVKHASRCVPRGWDVRRDNSASTIMQPAIQAWGSVFLLGPATIKNLIFPFFLHSLRHLGHKHRHLFLGTRIECSSQGTKGINGQFVLSWALRGPANLQPWKVCRDRILQGSHQKCNGRARRQSGALAQQVASPRPSPCSAVRAAVQWPPLTHVDLWLCGSCPGPQADR